jgi:hypothetical protein
MMNSLSCVRQVLSVGGLTTKRLVSSFTSGIASRALECTHEEKRRSKLQLYMMSGAKHES